MSVQMMTRPMANQRSAESPELADAVLDALLRVRDKVGCVSNEEVRQAAQVLACSPRTIRRMVAQGRAPKNERTHWVPNDDLFALLMTHGSVAALWEALDAKGEAQVTARTMQRGFERHYSTALTRFARDGMDAAEENLPTSKMPDLAVNEEWAMDDSELPIWCVMPDGSVAKPHQQSVIDGGSRFLLALTLAPYAFTSEDAVETLATAMVGQHTPDGVFIGGKPQALRTDRGSNFVSRASSLGLIAEDIARHYSEAYTPQQNGKIERWHRTEKKMFRHIPGFDRTAFKRGDPRKAATPPPASDVLIFEEVCVEVAKTVQHYNYKRVHRAHGMTPADAWAQEVAANPDAIEYADARAIRASMVQEMTRKLTRRRVAWDKRFYNLHPQSVGEASDAEVVAERRDLIDNNEGRDVSVRFLHGRVEYVSVYTLQGQYLGDAVWDDIQTVAQAGETASTRREHIKTMTSAIEDIARNDAAAVAARREAALAQTGPDVDNYGPKPKGRKNKPSRKKAARPKKDPAEKRRDDAAKQAEWVAKATA